jgi:hypothetical protein
MILIENDSLQMICNKLLNIKNPRIEELNSVKMVFKIKGRC